MNKSFSHLYKTINHVVNKHAPLRDASVRKPKMLTKPWLTAGLRKSIKVKNKLFFESNWPKYKIYRNKLTTLIRLSKQRHYQRFFDSNIKNTRSTWKGINEILGDAKKRKKSKRINFIRSNGHSVLSDDPKTIGNTLSNTSHQ